MEGLDAKNGHTGQDSGNAGLFSLSRYFIAWGFRASSIIVVFLFS